MKIVVTGASGLLGRAVYARLKADDHSVFGTAFSRANSENGLIKLDLTDFEALEKFLTQHQPDAIIHSAAERRPDVVERSPESCQLLNIKLPGEIASWCKKQTNVPLLINISTDYVFDGTSPPYKVDDTPNPLNAYGKSKWEGEKAVLENGLSGRVTNLRVPVLYGKTFSNDESAVNILLDALTVTGKDAKPKKMDANAVRYPTNVDDIAKALAQICSKFSVQSIPPTLHFSAMEAMSKYDMCLVMARCLRAVGEDAETEHLVPEYEVDPNAATSRPRHCKLDLSLTKEVGISTDCISFESWWREYLEEYAVFAREKRAREAEIAEARRIEERRKRKEEEEERLRLEEEQRRARIAVEEEERKLKEIEEEKRRKELEKEKRQKELQEEEEKKQKEFEEEAERKRLAEEEQRRDEEGQKEDHATSDEKLVKDEVGASDDAAGNNSRGSNALSNAPSSVGHTSLRSPSSPNPSFSSLQARPTPPATSGRSSPSASLRSVGASSLLTGSTTIPPRVEEDGTESQMTENVSENTNPLNNNDTLKSSEMNKHDASKQAKKAEDGSGFFPQKLVEAGDGASLGIDVAPPQDVDSSDNYGEPSPREPSSLAKAPFMATGYGEITFGMDGSTLQGDDGGQTDQQQKQTPTDSKPKSFLFQIKVGDPQKVGDPISAHIMYTMRINTNSPLFRSNQFSVLRRYSDFRWLHAALVHNNPGIFIPPVPEKVKIGRFAPDLVEARRHGLESCINKIANNPVLQIDDDFKIFLESQNFHADVKVRDQVKGPVPTPEQKTYFGWSTSLTGSTYKYHENDEWFEEQKVYLDHLEMQLKNLVRIVSILAQQRKDLAAATSEASHALMMLSGSSLSRSLSTCFAGLGEVERRIFELADVQADADVREFGSVLYEFERMVGSARKAFATRIDAWQTWQRLEDDWKKVRIKHEKVKKDSQPGMQRAHDAGRLPAVLDELAIVETKCLNAKREFDLIGRRCKEEMDRFEYDRIRTFHDSCEVWLQGMIERGHEIMSEWEQYGSLLERQTNHKIEVD